MHAPDAGPDLAIDEWRTDHPLWSGLLRLVTELDQWDWLAFDAAWHQSQHVLVASEDQVVVGFVRYVVQAIGADAAHDPVDLEGQVLTEAKILAFGVSPERRREGIGRRLQQSVVERAKRAGCHQIRSRSGGTNHANRQLKLSMGFGVQPLTRGEDRAGAYFILPLRT